MPKRETRRPAPAKDLTPAPSRPEEFRGGAAELAYFTICGDNMADTLLPGDQVLVDLRQRTPSPPGLFVISDGLGMVARRLEYLAHLAPPAVRIASDNPRYAPHLVAAERIEVVGRIIGCWREVP